MKNPIKRVILLILILFCPMTFSLAQPSLIGQLIDIQQAVVSITAKNTGLFKDPSVSAAIHPATGQLIIAKRLAAASYTRTGAGVIIHPDGILITNAHTGDRADVITVILQNGETFLAEPIRIIHGMDLLFLKINTDRPLPFIRFADSDHVSLGQEVLTIGNSSFLKDTITGGKIIGIGVSRTLKHSGIKRTDLIQTTINLYQGDSGGPLFNRNGELIGLMTADESSADHSSFAIPSNKIRQYLLEYLDLKKSNKSQ